MKRLILLGYAPAEKVAWPGGRLKGMLESLDPRHGVFPNLVMTPLLSTLCFVPAAEQATLLDDFRKNILEEIDGERIPRRYNVLATGLTEERERPKKGEPKVKRKRRKASEIIRKRSRFTEEVRAMLVPRATGASAQPLTTPRLHPGEDLCLVFSYWSTCAILASLVHGEPEEGWSQRDLRDFSNPLLRELLQAGAWELAGLPRRSRALPTAEIPKLGVYSQIIGRTTVPGVRDVLIRCVRKQFPATRGVEPGDPNDVHMRGVLQSILPLPHNELYQTYHEKNNPIGKYHGSFLLGLDPAKMQEDHPPDLLWRYVGETTARKLAESLWPDTDHGIGGKANSLCRT